MPIIDLKTAPEIKRLIRAADPSYKKHKAILCVTREVALSGTYWDGGSRSSYTAVNLANMRSSGAPQYAPSQFGGPRETPRVQLPSGACIVETGVFCGKTAAATVYLNPDDIARLLPNGVPQA